MAVILTRGNSGHQQHAGGDAKEHYAELHGCRQLVSKCVVYGVELVGWPIYMGWTCMTLRPVPPAGRPASLAWNAGAAGFWLLFDFDFDSAPWEHATAFTHAYFKRHLCGGQPHACAAFVGHLLPSGV